MNLGIIAEDQSDVDVLAAITRRMVAPRRIGFKRFIGHGCGKVRRKCRAWAEILVRQGCSWVVLIHDLDNSNEKKLRRDLEAAIAGTKANATLVLIPIREIESWLLYDAAALRTAFKGRSTPHLPANPEDLQDPKKSLESLVWACFRKQYLNTIHNGQIAKQIDTTCLRTAKSFGPFIPFTIALRRELR